MHELPPGSWPSELTAEQVTKGRVAYDEVAVTDEGRTVWWSESRPQEGGRTTIMRRTGDDQAVEVLPAEFDAYTRVHEYGGTCWLPVDGGVLTSNRDDQQLWLIRSSGDARALTPSTDCQDRYGDSALLPGGKAIICVRERVRDTVEHELVIVPLSGSGEVRVVWSGSDFVSAPRLSPDASSLAFLTWNHPHMPWDVSQLRVGQLREGCLDDVHVVLGGSSGESVQQPLWLADGTLLAITEVDGWWNVVASDGTPVWQVAEECGWPPWTLGIASMVYAGTGLAVIHGSARRSLSVLSTSNQERRDLALPFTSWGTVIAAGGTTVAAVVATPTSLPRVVAIDVSTGLWREVAGPEQPDEQWAPVPRSITLSSAGGRQTHAHVFPPRSPAVDTTPDEPVPYVVFVHGGPTGQIPLRYDGTVAYFTSRGIGVAQVDYAGSTGYGRAYRDALRGQWGVADVEDCEAVATWLVQQNLASAVAIRGGSAGGWTVLVALTRAASVFEAGTSYYGVAELLSFVNSTHDFESRYVDWLVGPLPESLDLYVDRSPLTHVDRLDKPLLALHGLDDLVVPAQQAELLVDALRRRHVPHAYLSFAGEAHGFRKQESMIQALEAELAFYGGVFGFVPVGVPALQLDAG